jgi:hydroxymethylbilane synthase
MATMTTRQIMLGTRPSALARWQTRSVQEQLGTAWPGLRFETLVLVTEGDKNLDKPLPEIGGKGVFTAELETALRSGEIDLAVHSLKDLPIEDRPGLCIGAVTRRADARDVLISADGATLQNLRPGARLGTSSLRREAQVRVARPDLTILPLRGNVDTRIRKALRGEYDAILLAAAGVERLGLGGYITEYLPFETMLPAPGQGALAVQCRAGDAEMHRLIQPIHDLDTFRSIAAERSFLAALGGGCSAPVAAYARVSQAVIELTGLVASIRLPRVIRLNATGDDPLVLGKLLAKQALDQGAGELLK